MLYYHPITLYYDLCYKNTFTPAFFFFAAAVVVTAKLAMRHAYKPASRHLARVGSGGERGLDNGVTNNQNRISFGSFRVGSQESLASRAASHNSTIGQIFPSLLCIFPNQGEIAGCYDLHNGYLLTVQNAF